MNLSEQMGRRQRMLRKGRGFKMWSHPMIRAPLNEDPYDQLAGRMMRMRAERVRREKQARKLFAQAMDKPQGANVQLDSGGDYSPGNARIEPTAAGTEQTGPA